MTTEPTLPLPLKGHDFDAFLGRIEAERHYAGQIVNVTRLPERPARHADPREPLSVPLRSALSARGIDRLYAHQAEAINLAREGEHVVVVTGTASGKTLAYNLPVVERLMAEPDSTALYLFPTKALAQDQLKGLTRFLETASAALPPEDDLITSIRPGVYDGDTSQSARRKIRDTSRLVLSNPDMLHRALLPYHGRWARFLSQLRYVIIDEIHSYRGIFGSNVANVIRRLRRVAAHHGADPQFLSSSATIRNPVELAEALTGVGTRAVTDDGSPRGPRWFVTWNPPHLDAARVERRSGNVEAMEILLRLVREGVATIVFCKARVVAELIYKYAHDELRRKDGALAGRLTPYRSGYLPGERRAIEKRLFDGELLGVVSTNALELGIDIGSLDASIVVGFPGTFASVWQQSGRAGRGHDGSLTIFVAYDDPIDQYLARHPDYFLGQAPEAAAIDPGNPYILAGHLACAAFELPLGPEDEEIFGCMMGGVREALTAEDRLTHLGGLHYWGSTDFPAQRVNLRTISDDTYSIVDATNGDKVIGMVDAISAPELVYPEAIYLHEGETWFVKKLDMDQKVAYVEPVSVDYYTQPVLDTSLRVTERRIERWSGAERLTLNRATVTWATTMFKKIQFGSTDSIGYKNLALPPQHLDTVALGWSPSEEVRNAVRADGRKPAEGLSGIRNLMITVLPLYSMCDRSDIGGVIDSSNFGHPTLFLYDRFAGGVGFTERGYTIWEEMVLEALRLLEDCPCQDGCPSCVGLPILRPAQHQDPDVMNGFPIPDKGAARVMLRGLITP
ncbi:MAG: DEAD/DEAH box helicase [Candidatus Eisenbacteria bacterium]|nr:DEAD/DEAH box helicase [Candidatus Eisenbacteria bacterium]